MLLRSTKLRQERHEVRTPILQLRITSIASDALLDMPLLTELG
jgi:hypothetical protein